MNSSFQKRIYRVVKKIPKGEVMSYDEVARAVGKPRAWRAVGNVLNKNQDPKIPCHRVIKSNGKIGGYNRGKTKKISLLRKESLKISGNLVNISADLTKRSPN